ncbi:MAG: hypothetical protein Q8O38_10730 [Sulfurimicrobium sp.]|nr:hypothetical protein [Sulfurimicrobium sp.]
MQKLNQLRADIAVIKSEIKKIKRSPAPESEMRAAIESKLSGMAAEWCSFEEKIADSAALLTPGGSIATPYMSKDFALSGLVHLNRKSIVDALLKNANIIRSECGLPPAMTEQERDAELTAAVMRLYELELQEAELLYSMPEQMPRIDMNVYALLGMPIESVEREVILSTIRD